MGKNNRITENEKELLHARGRHPEMSVKELLSYTKYKWKRTVSRKLTQLREQHILSGSIYDLNYTKLCRNPLHKVLCIFESNQSLETVISYLKVIEPLLWTFPVLSSHKRVLNAGFFSTDDAALATIFQVLKDNNIVTDYAVRAFCTKRMIENPNLFGDLNPPLDNLLDPCDVPDMSLAYHDTEWNRCDMSILPHLMKGAKLVKILRKENDLHENLTYEKIKYSRRKMVKNGLIEKKYIFNPLPVDQCVEFQMFLKIEDTALAPHIIYNFARGERVFKQYALFEEWGTTDCIWGSTSCVSHPLFLKDLVHKLDEIDEIGETEIYLMRSYPLEKYRYSRPLDLKYFDFEKQTIQYPYHGYEEKIKEKIENEQVIFSV